MFRRRKGNEKKAGDAVPAAPNLTDGDGGGWYKKPGSDPNPDINIPLDIPLGIPPSVQSTAPTFYDGGGGSSPAKAQTKKSPPSLPRKQSQHSVDEFCAVIGVFDWNAATKIFDEDPKVATKTAILTLKGQRTECNPLHLLVISSPPMDFLERVLNHYPAAAHNTDRNGDRTALHWACIANESPQILDMIVNANVGACKHQDRSHGRTPLHYLAIQANDPEQIHVLMEADKRAAMVKDSSQKTPMDLAQDSSNPSKLDIIPALQRRRSSGGIFSGIKKVRSRNASPGKYKKRGQSPGKYSAPDYQTNGEEGNQTTTDSRRPRRSSRSTVPERAAIAVSGANAAAAQPRNDQYSRVAMPVRLDQPNGGDNNTPSRRVNQYHQSAYEPRPHGIESSGEFDSDELGVAAPPRLAQQTSSSMYMPRQAPGGSYTPPRSYSPPRNNLTSNSPGQSAATRNRSNSPILSSRDHSPMPRHQAVQASPEPRTIRSDQEQAHKVAPRNRTSNSSSSRPSNQGLAAGMDESIRVLKNQLERKRGILREKDMEIAQIGGQIQQAAREEDTLNRQREEAQPDQSVLVAKQEKIATLKEQIDGLKAELRRTEKEVKKIESKSYVPSGNMDFVTQQIHAKKDEQSTLRAVMGALEEEKKTAKRDVDNIESELKSMETIHLLAQGEDIG